MYVDVYVSYPVDGIFTYRVPAGIKAGTGIRVRVNFKGRDTVAFPVRFHDIEPGKYAVKDIIEAIDREPIYGEKLIDLSEFVSSNYLSTPGEAMAMALPSGLNPSERFKPPYECETGANVSLTPDQQVIYGDIISSYNKGELNHLLFGVTGSGKTEIYMEVCRHFTAIGKSVIFMVPEISLSSQIFHRLWKVFSGELIVYHSQLTPGQRLYNWLQFYKGNKKIAVGTRSSVFLQCPSLGAVIIDEEHDGSYKENSTPRYNARRVAFYRCRMENALLLLGSATPSVETLYSAERGVIRLHLFNKRYGGSKLPEVDIVKISSGKSSLSSLLKLHTKRAIDGGFQAIYLLNRRGFSPFVVCDSCGTPVQCPDCSISLNYHKTGHMLCHYCGYKRALPEGCEKCGTGELVKVGAGTQRVEETIKESYRDFRILRLDQDSARKKDAVYDIIGRMGRGEADILLGTQMVAKGFDFPGVTVVGILMADIGLNMPDFRASERIFSLLVQVAGRCGRGVHPGRVILQTLNDELEIYRFIKNHDYHGFYKWELGNRKALNYPPFSRMIRLLVRGVDEPAVIESAGLLKDEIMKNIEKKGYGITVLGPSSAPIMKIGKNFRHHIVLKSDRADEMKEIVLLSKKAVAGRKVYLEIDVDPYEMM